MRRIAALDIGSNSLKLLIADIVRNRMIPSLDTAVQTRLSRGMTDRLSDEAMIRTQEALAAMAQTILEHQCDETLAVGTACLREASNADDFLAALRDRTGITARVIDGYEEARLTYLGALSGLSGRPVLVVLDLGGRSLEVTLGRGMEILHRFSLPLGAVSTTEAILRDDPPSAVQAGELIAMARRELDILPAPPAGARFVATGGAAVTLGSLVTGSPERIADETTRLAIAPELADRLVDRLLAVPTQERRLIPGMIPERADIIPAGALIFREAMRVLGCGRLEISPRGLRHGLVRDRIRSGRQ